MFQHMHNGLNIRQLEELIIFGYTSNYILFEWF